MATINVAVGPAWTLVVAGAKTWFTVSVGLEHELEFATSVADGTAPVVANGHRLIKGMGITRTLFPSGSIWARAVGITGTIPVAVDSN
jgi:hypothetical protein